MILTEVMKETIHELIQVVQVRVYIMTTPIPLLFQKQ